MPSQSKRFLRRGARWAALVCTLAVAAGHAGAQNPAVEGSAATPAADRRPYAAKDLADLLARRVPTLWLVAQVRRNCLAAPLSSSDEQMLRGAGADDDLIGAFKLSCVASGGEVAAGVEVTPGVRKMEEDCGRGLAAACDSAAAKYTEGIFAPKDPLRAAELLLSSCNLGNRSACERAVTILETSADPATQARGAKVLTLRCDQNELAACRRLGGFYERGTGVPKDGERALALYQRACEGGEVGGCVAAARVLLAGSGVARDSARGLGYAAVACERGVGEGVGADAPVGECARAGAAFASGRGGVAADGARAVLLYQRGCDAGDARACGELGELVLAGKAEGRVQSHAAALFDKGCAGGRIGDCAALAALLDDGKLVVRDQKRAAALYEQACKGDVANACYAAGHALTSIDSSAEAATRAAAMYEKGCVSDPRACGALGEALLAGTGVARDLPRARELLGRACQGDVLSYCVVQADALLAEAPPGDSVLQSKAAALRRRACDGKVPSGCRELGRSHLKGEGVPRDARRAEQLFTDACDADDGAACGELGALAAANKRADQTRVVAFYSRGCTLGDGESCNVMGDMLWRGRPVAKDHVRAVEMYEKGCRARSRTACWSLARALGGGDGVPADDARAAKAYGAGCDLGDGRSCAELAGATEAGRGVPSDPARATALYARACELGWSGEKCKKK